MHTISETNDLFEQIDQELIDQDYSGIRCVIDDLIPEYITPVGENLPIDWFGFSDLTI
jgi:hypothetical protein